MEAQASQYIAPVAVRSRLMLEMASEMIGTRGWPYRQVRISMRDQHDHEDGGWGLTVFASDSPSAIHEVASHDVHFALINPGVLLTLALKGTGPFEQPIPVRAITVLHSYDQLVLAVSEKSGLTSLEDIKQKRYPLRLSLRGQRDHGSHLVVDEVLAAAGFSLDDIRAWGGEVRYDQGMPSFLPMSARLAGADASQNRLAAVERGEVDAIFDEGATTWTNQAAELGMRMLPIEGEVIQQLESIGFRSGMLERTRFPGLPSDIPTLDYSGFIVYTHADVPDDIVRTACASLETRKDRIPTDKNKGRPPLPLHEMCTDSREGPLGIPLHPAAEQFWREQGYL